MRTMTLRIALVMVVCAAGTARAACPDKRASCVLHEEGVALFMDGKNDLAAAKFAAAIAAEPTARSYLGYAQAVESLGQIALAYDTMVAAQRLSTKEVEATGGKDVDVSGRAERIKYKLGELRAKIGFVWLRVPEGVAPQRVVSVQRQGEGDLYQPLTQWTAVSPGKQILVASIDDGSKVEIAAQVAAGSQAVVVIPLTARPGQQRPPSPNNGFTPPPVPGTGDPGTGVRPIGTLYQPIIKPPAPAYTTYFALNFSVLADAPTGVGTGTGLNAIYERPIASSLGITTRAEFDIHGDGDAFDNVDASGSEVLLIAGLRTLGSRTLHGRAGVGVTIYSQHVEDPSTGAFNDFTQAYPVFELGAGLHLGRFRMMAGVLFAASPGAAPGNEMPTRFMFDMGIDLYRK
jgi:hypothetical protein